MSFKRLRIEVETEIRALLSLAWPSCLISLSFTGIGLINSIIVGHLGTVYLAAVAYSDIVMEYTLLLFLQGFNQGLRSLSAQAYGAKNDILVGQYCQLALLAVTVCSVPLGLIWWSIGNVLQLVHTTEETIYYATIYSRLSLLSLLPRIFYSVIASYFLSQQIVLPTAIISIVFLAIHYLLNSMFVHGFLSWQGLGFIGCPIATATTMYMRLLTLLLYMFGWRQLHLATWRWSWDFLDRQKFSLLVRIGVPLMIGNAFEDAQLQICALFAGILGQVDLAAHSAMLQLFLTMTCPIYGLNSGSIARMGYYLGAGSPAKARGVSYIHLGCILCIAVVVVMFYGLYQYQLGHLFSNDPLVWHLIQQICLIAAAGFLFLSFFYFSMAILTAQARPIPILVSFLIGAWLIGVPTAYLLGIHWTYGLPGIWLGMSGGYLITTSISLRAALQSDWHAASHLAQVRAGVTVEDTSTSALLPKPDVLSVHN